MDMSNTVLKIENLSKQYRLGQVGTGTLSHDLNRWWHKVRGKEDPYALVGQTNDRSQKAESDYVWALKDINFEVKEGDVLGIIGKNGAGKSTLLKIISQITAPTTGSIRAKGRIASLLEVGTGMHPEMTARENIYLNGAILGMKKKEIDNKFDEILDFSGCTMYVDTPIKRFSSGMRVRLGFAVAAFLEPEILIVDEVLAVGDAEFQKKAIGKMQDISNNTGRTVLFVSHNMATVNKICKNSLLLEYGKIIKSGLTSEIIPYYLSSTQDDKYISIFETEENENKRIQIIRTEIIDNFNNIIIDGIISTNQLYSIKIRYRFRDIVQKCHLTIVIKNSLGEVVLFIDRTDFHKEFFVATKPYYEAIVNIQNPLLKPGVYYVTLGLADLYSMKNDHKFDVLKFKIEDIDSIRDSRQGDLFLPTKWDMNEVNYD